MTNKETHKRYLTTGSLFWIASFFGEESRLQPFSTAGIILSSVLMIIGLVYWFWHYKSTRGHYPKFWAILKELYRKLRKNPFSGISFMSKHLAETWTFVILFWMMFVLVGWFTFGNSDAFEATKIKCENSKEITNKTGKIRYFGFLVSGDIYKADDNGSADLSFTIVAEKGNFFANSKLTESNGQWEVDELIIK